MFTSKTLALLERRSSINVTTCLDATIKCPDLMGNAPNLKSMCTIANHIGSECVYTCEGARLEGSSRSVCIKTVLREAKWSPPIPTCVEEGNCRIKRASNFIMPYLSV